MTLTCQSVNFLGDNAVTYVDSISDLRLLKPGINGEVVVTSGSSILGDGLGTMYVWSDTSTGTDDGANIITSQYSGSTGRWLIVNSSSSNEAVIATFKTELASSSGSNLIGYQYNNDANDRTVHDRLADSVSVKDFGAVGDGNTDDTAAIQNAISNLSANGGGELYIPKGTYKLTSTLTINGSNIFIRGAGHGATILSFNATTDSLNGIIFTSPSGSNQYRGSITDLAILLTGTAQSSTSNCYGLQTNAANDLYFERLLISGFANGLGIIDSANTVRIDTVDVTDIINNAFVIASPTSQYFSNCTAYQNSSPTGSGFNILETGGAQFVNCVTGGSNSSGAASGYQYGINIDPSANANVQDLQFVNCNLDDSAIAAVNINPNQSGYVTNIEFHNMRSGWGNKYGVIINGSTPDSNGISSTSGIKFIGGSTSRNLETGVVINGGDNIYFDGFHVRGNGVETSNTYDGYLINGGSFIYITNGMSSSYASSDGNNTYTPTQRYGVVIGSSFTGKLICSNMNMSNNLSGTIYNDASTSASIFITNCYGGDPINTTTGNITVINPNKSSFSETYEIDYASNSKVSFNSDGSFSTTLSGNTLFSVGGSSNRTLTSLPLTIPTYTISTLPGGMVDGTMIYVSDAQKTGETGTGTGNLAFFSNSFWYSTAGIKLN